MPLPVVILTEGSAARPLQWLRERAEVIEAPPDSPALLEHLPRADALCVRTYTRVDAAMLDRAPRLRVVARGGVGLENVDVVECRSRGVEVVYVPDANTLAVGDYVITMMTRLVRPFGEFDTYLPPAEFRRRRETLRGRQLNELTLGVVGMGRVGRRVGRIAAHGFGMRVVYHDLADVSSHIDFPCDRVAPDTLYSTADVVSLHVDARPGNTGLVGRDALARMKPGAVLLNTCRGEVLDATATADAVRCGRLAGVAVDVFDPEPPSATFPLFGLPNVLLTPHMGSRTETALENMSWVVRDLMAVLDGRTPEYPAPAAE